MEYDRMGWDGIGWDGMEWGVIANLEREREPSLLPSILSFFLYFFEIFALFCSSLFYCECKS